MNAVIHTSPAVTGAFPVEPASQSLDERMMHALAGAITATGQSASAFFHAVDAADHPQSLIRAQTALARHGLELNFQTAVASHVVKSVESLLKS
ncbi:MULTISPECIES: hypothetical protein [Dyella]|uniref:Uncharacterized protein n=2 Tax=Dyella TaxID=231454 RepID=A0A4R0YWB6_9GAMM|nr:MULTISPECIES: hypothetical protein [Dyella]TBR38717.1 hypothetical protein EYV96_00210 [Dyella terrae]TCI13692.1 hypothetical protein EZM97_10660 [Dyella soli]